MEKELKVTIGMSQLMNDLRLIVNSAKARVASVANAELTMMYWHIGHRVNVEILGNERAAYGKQIVSQVARQLQEEYGRKGFELRSIRRMMQFASEFPDEQIVSAVSTQLTWSHIVEILPLKDSLQREFYLSLSASERWGTRRLRKEIDSMLYERTAIAAKPDESVKRELAELRKEIERQKEIFLEQHKEKNMNELFGEE